MRIRWTDRVSNEEEWKRTDQVLVKDEIEIGKMR